MPRSTREIRNETHMRPLPFAADRQRRLSVSRLLHLSTPPSSKPRTIPSTRHPRNARSSSLAPNLVKNQNHNIVMFLPLVLYEQFKFFYDLCFLLVAL
ncbi:Putative aminophospholipid-translocase [Rhodotorula toruloides]